MIKEDKDMPNERDIPMESIENDAYANQCRCPKCRKLIARGSGESTCFCPKCGQKLHLRPFTEEEIKRAIFEDEMDDYED